MRGFFVRMRSQVYPTRLRLLRPFLACLLALAVTPLVACGDDDDDTISTSPDDDAGKREDAGKSDDLDAAPFVPPEFDAGMEIPGDPPKELADQACAADTNKVYDLVTQMRAAVPTQMAADVEGSRFAFAFVDASKQCVDALYFAELEGAPTVGKPEVALALDPCSEITHASIAYNGNTWLLGSVDARKDSRDLWMQTFDGKKAGPSYRVTENVEVEREVAMVRIGGGMLAAWVEQPVDGGATTLKVRPLNTLGNPTAKEAKLEQPDGAWIIGGLSMARIGDFAGLGYRRVSDDGTRSEIVLDILDENGARDRDSWVLSTEAGSNGSIDLASDEEGAGAIYSLNQGESQQLWFQPLGLDGRALPVMTGGKTGGGADPHRIVGPPDKAADVSMTKLPVGFAVAYRVLPSVGVDSPRIRVHFLESFGRIIGMSDVALATMYGGRTAIESAYDGRVVIGYSDSDDETGATTIYGIKLPCVGGL
jgi:hypothetical protein